MLNHLTNHGDRDKMKKLFLITSSAILFTVCACAPAINAHKNITLVYINNGAIQCQGHGKSGDVTAAILEKAHINVHATQCARLTNIAVITMCGSPATNINLHEINTKDLAAAQLLGFKNVMTLKTNNNNKGYEVLKCK